VSSEAPLPRPDICTRALAERKVTEARSRLAAGEAWMASGLVLTTGYGTPIDPRNFQRFFQAGAAKADVAIIPVHATQRTCASLLVALDVHPRVAMTILRHSKIAVTMDIYTQVSSASTKEALKRPGNEFGQRVLRPRWRTFLEYGHARGPSDERKGPLTWWRHGESNPGPPACKAGALPIELCPRGRLVVMNQPKRSFSCS
jgi:hypothetical protein